jgi:hypothetical protein
MPDANIHQGSCHCGAVRFETATDLGQVITCNCSICAKHGLLFTFVPADQFTLRSGEERLTPYQFNKKMIQHMFCRDCGVETFGKGTRPVGSEMVAVNVRCLDGVDLAALKLTPFDGKNL